MNPIDQNKAVGPSTTSSPASGATEPRAYVVQLRLALEFLRRIVYSHHQAVVTVNGSVACGDIDPEHKFFCDYWFLTRWWNKIREFGDLLARNEFLEDSEDVFQLSRYEVASALDELVLTWATGGLALGPKHWPPIIARRKEILERLGEWTPPPAIGVTPDAVTDPMVVMLWGVTTERVQEWARQVDGGNTLNGAAASPGVVEGEARVVRSVDQIRDVRDGEILVCGSTSPAWAPIFSKIRATVTDVGGVMSHAAIVAREYGLPAVVGTGRATSAIRTGQMIRVDGTEGTVTLL